MTLSKTPDSTTRSAGSSQALQRLRVATGELHTRLDHDSSMQLLLKTELTLSQYAHILKSLHTIYGKLERVIQRAETEHGKFMLWESKLPHIAADLASLGHSPTPESPGDGIGLLRGLDEVAGCMYVLEGASLGGQVIRARILKHWGPQAESCTRFFNGNGKATHARWVKTVQQIDAILANEVAIGRACACARSVFDLFITELKFPDVVLDPKVEVLEMDSVRLH